jgi:hypothetical protein
MTLIVVNPNAFQSKATLKQALDSGKCWLWEPSIMGEWKRPSSELPIGFKAIVTRMPKRDKFASIEKLPDGTWKVR